MDITIIAAAQHQRRCAEAIQAGVHAIGGTARISHKGTPPSTRQVCCWGWRTGSRLRAEGHDVLVMERAYMGDRFEWYSLGWNGLNGRATFPTFKDPAGRRFGEHFAHLLQPWKRGGEFALLVGQVPGDMSLGGRDLRPWYNQAAIAANNAYEMPVVFRPHPVAVQKGHSFNVPLTTRRPGELADVLADAAVCITFNSNTAVEAVLAGVPSVVLDEGSMAWPVAAHRVGVLARPERTAWAHELAWRQWQLDEIATGQPFKGVQC